MVGDLRCGYIPSYLQEWNQFTGRLFWRRVQTQIHAVNGQVPYFSVIYHTPLFVRRFIRKKQSACSFTMEYFYGLLMLRYIKIVLHAVKRIKLYLYSMLPNGTKLSSRRCKTTSGDWNRKLRSFMWVRFYYEELLVPFPAPLWIVISGWK